MKTCMKCGRAQNIRNIKCEICNNIDWVPVLKQNRLYLSMTTKMEIAKILKRYKGLQLSDMIVNEINKDIALL